MSHQEERTLVIIKPDAVQRGLIGKIAMRFEERGLKIAAGKFTAKVPGAYAKLTTVTPIRNPVNKPDEWEAKACNMFRSSNYEKNKQYSEVTTFRGKKALRLMQPEYYGEGCMACHGSPKGEVHVGGGKKEGLKVGEAGAGFSIVIPLK